MADRKKGRMSDKEAREALRKDPRAQELLELLKNQDLDRTDAMFEALNELEKTSGEDDKD